METWDISQIAGAAMEGLLFEVSAIPKPGLVTPISCGAHLDMDYYTFLSSASALHSCFDKMTAIGRLYTNDPIHVVLPPLRKVGTEQEKLMYAFTNGINTHKGLIFTLGILCGCAGWAWGKLPMEAEVLGNLAADMCAGMCQRELASLSQKPKLTKGERMYLQYGITGARGEAEGGYQTILRVSLPVYKDLKARHIDNTKALAQTLLHLIAATTDTNILSRHNLEMVGYAREKAVQALALGGLMTPSGAAFVAGMEQDFIKRNISPGGCADLLAATHFLYKLERMNL